MAHYILAKNLDPSKLPNWLTPTESFTYLRVDSSLTLEEAKKAAIAAGIQVVGVETRVNGYAGVTKRVEDDR